MRQTQADGGVVDNGDEFINEFLGEAGCADVERRTDLFDIIAKDFSTQVGKVRLLNLLSIGSESCFPKQLIL